MRDPYKRPVKERTKPSVQKYDICFYFRGFNVWIWLAFALVFLLAGIYCAWILPSTILMSALEQVISYVISLQNFTQRKSSSFLPWVLSALAHTALYIYFLFYHYKGELQTTIQTLKVQETTHWRWRCGWSSWCR